jgi:hypothetical protein
MKINKNDIEQGLIDKVNRLDKIVDNFKDEDRASFVAYNGESFYLKRISDLNIRRILSESDLENYKAHLYNQEGLIKNSFTTNFNNENKSASNFKSQIVKAKEELLYTSTGRILLSKRYGSILYFLNDKGILVKYNLTEANSEYAVDLIKETKTNFAIKSIAPYDFLYLEPVSNGILISTVYNGVFFYDFVKKSLEIKFTESNVVVMKHLNNGNVMCGIDRIDGNTVFFDFESGLKVETSNVLKRKMFQVPHLIDSYKDHLFIVGKPYSLNTTKDLIHYWRKDDANLSFNNADGEVFPGYEHKNYLIKYLTVTDGYAYVSGLKENKELFVWQYDLSKLSEPFKEFSFKNFLFSQLSFVELSEEYFIAADGNRLFYMNSEGGVEKNIQLSESVKDIFFTKDTSEFVMISDQKIIKVTLPDYKHESELILNIFESDKDCNNIDIFIKSSDGREKYAFIDTETVSSIAPFYLATYENNTIVKLLGSTAKHIIMKISIPEGTQIEGIVVNANRLFLK